MKPALRLLLMPGIWCFVAFSAVVMGLPLWIWTCSGVFIFFVLAVDLVWVLLLPAPSMERRSESILALGVSTQIELGLKNTHARSNRLEIYDHYPPSFRAEGLPIKVVLRPCRETSVTYHITPTERGKCNFGKIAAWMTSPLGIWLRKIRGGETKVVRVYPNFQSLVRYTLMKVENRVDRLGIHKVRRRGTGLEFHQLREYRVGDSPNQINWKATSKRLKLISCEYQDEQDQQVMLLLDCGRRMRAKDDELSHFDHALNAVLLLAHIALRQGDSVGLMTFGGTARHLSPRKGVSTINNLLNATYDILPTVFASDLARALEDCAGRIRKRSLIVLISNISDQQPENLISVTRTLLKRHLVLFTSLREIALEQAVETEVHDLHTALRVSAAHNYMEMRNKYLKSLKAEGIICLDTLPFLLAPALANIYFEIKADRLL